MKIIISPSLLLFLLSPEFSFPVAAQPGSSPGSTPNNGLYTSFSPSLGVIMAILITSLFFIALFSIYIRHCNGSSSGSVPAINRRGVVRALGLDLSVLDTFPTFTYSEVKEHKIVNGALECAVCLNEFEDDETLRLIPKCDHVFHPECIDAWLEFHVTCPVCRADLVPKPGDEPVRVPDLINNEGSMRNENNIVESSNSRNDEIVIEVDDEPVMENRNLSFHYPSRPRPIPFGVDKFRSYSTGHSLVQPVKDLERFTLRLPAEVRKQGIERAMLNPPSIAARLPREGSSRKGFRTEGGEGSSRGGRFYRIDRSDREVKSDRWDFVTRAFSTTSRSQKAVEGTEEGSGSTSKGAGNRTPVKMPSFKCLEPKAVDETGLFSDKPVRHEI